MQLNLYKRERLRIIGIYLIIILVLSRFALWPLSSSVEEKKTLLNEHLETYRAKAMLVQKKGLVDKATKKSASLQEKELMASLFPKGTLVSEIQIQTINAITKSVEMNGLSMINFQLPEDTVNKDLSEVSVIVSLQGMPGDIIKLLKEIHELKMLTDIKNLRITSNRTNMTVNITLANYRTES